MARRGQGDHGRRLSDADKTELERRIAAGDSQDKVARVIGCDVCTVIRWVLRNGGLRTYQRHRSALRPSLEEREAIVVGIARGVSATAIARRLGREPLTITRELNANGARDGYVACRADERALRQARRPKEAKLARCPRLCRQVEAGLAKRRSPSDRGQPGFRLPRRPGDAGVARDDLPVAVRAVPGCAAPGTGRQAAHRASAPPSAWGPAGREPPRHGADLRAAGRGRGSSRAGTLGGRLDHRQGRPVRDRHAFEWTSRFLLLVQFPSGRTAESVRDALSEIMPSLPAALRRSLTWDQGKEMAEHARFTIDTGITVYFCDPSAPWQRGTNENTNGLLRQYFPKGTDLTPFDQAALDAVADGLNDRPRQTLSWMKPSDAYNQLVARTA